MRVSSAHSRRRDSEPWRCGSASALQSRCRGAAARHHRQGAADRHAGARRLGELGAGRRARAGQLTSRPIGRSGWHRQSRPRLRYLCRIFRRMQAVRTARIYEVKDIKPLSEIQNRDGVHDGAHVTDSRRAGGHGYWKSGVGAGPCVEGPKPSLECQIHVWRQTSSWFNPRS
jgi:hypothetical protein